MVKKSLLSFSALGMVSLLGMAMPNFAEAKSWTDVRNSRAELRRDQAELQRDRTDLRNLYRSGASRSDINNKRNEIRGDLREVAQGRRELRNDYFDLRRDRSGNYGRFDKDHRWNRYDNGRWEAYDRWSPRDRWAWR
jgi:hypothetical protein